MSDWVQPLCLPTYLSQALLMDHKLCHTGYDIEVDVTCLIQQAVKSYLQRTFFQEYFLSLLRFIIMIHNSFI